MPGVERLALTRIGGAVAIPAVLRELGVDADSIIQAVGLRLQVFENPENTIPIQTLGRLVSRCVAATNCEHFGLLVGHRQTTSSLGYVGLLAENSPDVRTALNNLARYLHLHDEKSVLTLELTKSNARVGYTTRDLMIPSINQIVDGNIMSTVNIMRRMCGEAWRPIEVMLPRPRPRDVTAYLSFFEAPVNFGAENGAVVFRADWLNRPVAGANPLLRRLLETHIQMLDARLNGGLSERLKRLVRTLIGTRQCSLEIAAHLFNMNPRMLSRSLEREGVKFREVVDELRYEVARHLLAATSLSLTEIAASLDYSESSAFTRAFRRWSGRLPSKWRSEYASMQLRAPANGKANRRFDRPSVKGISAHAVGQSHAAYLRGKMKAGAYRPT